MKILVRFLAALSLPFSAAVLAQPSNMPLSLQELIKGWKTRQAVPAISVSVQKLDQPQPLTYLQGTTTLNGKKKINAETLFQIGSITKTFVSALILQLEAEGKLNINDAIGPWFPEYPRWRAITIRQLLNMSSGIYNYSEDIDTRKMTLAEKQKIWQPAELIKRAYQKEDYFAPGSGWHYSNTNYLLAGLLLEHLTGQKLETLLNERLLHKFALKNTFYFPLTYPPAILKRLAHGYRDHLDATVVSPSLFGSAGSMLSNSPDLLKWTQLLFSGQVLPPKQQQEFMTTIPFPDTPPKPLNSRFGLGIYATEQPGFGTLWWYSGVTSGYISLLVWIPAKETLISANINRWQGEHYGVLMPKQEFLDSLLTGLNQTHYWNK